MRRKTLALEITLCDNGYEIISWYSPEASGFLREIAERPKQKVLVAESKEKLQTVISQHVEELM